MGQRVQIEGTSKGLKLAWLITGVIAFGSVGMCAAIGGDTGSRVGIAGLIVTFIAGCVIRAIAWWQHG